MGIRGRDEGRQAASDSFQRRRCCGAEATEGQARTLGVPVSQQTDEQPCAGQLQARRQESWITEGVQLALSAPYLGKLARTERHTGRSAETPKNNRFRSKWGCGWDSKAAALLSNHHDSGTTTLLHASDGGLHDRADAVR